MKVCHICGESKDNKEFFKIKHLYKYCNLGRRLWCRPCQKMYVDMKKQEDQRKQFNELKFGFSVSFT